MLALVVGRRDIKILSFLMLLIKGKKGDLKVNGLKEGKFHKVHKLKEVDL